MNDSHDNEAAGRIEDWLEMWTGWNARAEDPQASRLDNLRLRLAMERRPGADEPTVADLRAVLAENKTMRQQLTGLKTEWGVRSPVATTDSGVWVSGDDEDAEEYARRRGAIWARSSDATVVSRLVGEWQPAGPAQDEQAATGGNDNSKGN